MLAFEPLTPKRPAGHRLRSLSIHVRDHKRRELPIADRSLEAHFDGFVLSQSHKGAAEAEHQALLVSYGRDPREALICGHPGRVYELGPEPLPDDPDGRMPAVVVWHDRGMFYLLASERLSSAALIEVANAIYKGR